MVTPALVIVAAREPATPPDIVKVLPYAGMSATTPVATSTPVPIGFTASPAVKLSEKLKAEPEDPCQTKGGEAGEDGARRLYLDEYVRVADPDHAYEKYGC